MSIVIPQSKLESFEIYKYPLKGNSKYNYIPIFCFNITDDRDFTDELNVYVDGYEFVNPNIFKEYELNTVMWLWRRPTLQNFDSGIFGDYNDDKITIESSESATKAEIKINAKNNNTEILNYSITHSTDTNVISYAHCYLVAIRRNGKTVVSSGGVLNYNGNADIKDYAYALPSKGYKGFIDIQALLDGYSDYNLYGFYNNSQNQALDFLLDGLEPIQPPDKNDPNGGGGDSKGGGGGGDGDIGGDTNPDDGLPDISALDSGLLTAYNPNVSELQALGRFLWSDSFDVNTFKKLFNDPFDTLLGLSIVPVAPKTSGTKNIMFGNMDSGVSSAVISNQWVSMDMGTLHLNEVWKGALDYAPSTGVCIHLPFIGMRQLNVNDIMGSALHLIYKFDVLTGAVIAQIYVDHDARNNPSQGFSYTKNMGLCYEFIGQCGENIPLASQDFTNTIRAAISGVSVAAGTAASVATGNPALGIASLTVGAANAGMQANTPTVERGGHLSGSASLMGYSQPFLIVERPHQCKPSRYYSLRGIPSQVYTSKLANCTGFTQITDNNNIHCSGAQDSEIEEIERLLTSGVYFPDKVR